MSKPRLLDLFCGAGGAAKGYQQAGFYVVGVDNRPQPHYCGDEFYQADALEFISAPLWTHVWFDAIHASPPCQRWSSITGLRNALTRESHPDLIEPTRTHLIAAGLPWVMENVDRAPMPGAMTLCGSMFGLRVRRHRLFESSEHIWRIPCQHRLQPRPIIAVFGDHPEDAWIYPSRGKHTAKRAKSIDEAREAMGIDWMDWDEITQAIPPAFTAFIGEQLMAHLGVPV